MKRIIPVLISILILASCSTVKYLEVPSEVLPSASVEVLAYTSEPESEEEEEEVTQVYEGEEIIQEAKKFLGYNYVWGCESPQDGFDCSGLVYYLYKSHGYRLMRVADDQSHQGEKVDDIEDALPGDLLCFKRYNYCPHIGLYIGDGLFIHAKDEESGVIITHLDEYLQKYDLEIRRIIGYVEKKPIEEIEKEEQEFLALLAEIEEAKAREAAATPTSDPAPTPEDNVTTVVNDPDEIYVIPVPETSEPSESMESSESSEASEASSEPVSSEEEQPAESVPEQSEFSTEQSQMENSE